MLKISRRCEQTSHQGKTDSILKDAQSYVSQELQIKTMRYHYVLIRMAESPKCWKYPFPVRMWSNRNCHSLWMGMQNGSHFGRTQQFLAKLSIVSRYAPAIVLLNVYQNELKTYVHKKSCPWIFIAALFTITLDS